MNEVTIPAARLRTIAAALLEAGGFTREESEITAHSLVESNLAGVDSHGIVRVAEYIRARKRGIIVSNAPFTVLREAAACCLADAKRGLGQVQMPLLLDIVARKARDAGTATGAMTNSGHVGRLGEWVESLARGGLAAFAAVNDNGTLQIVAPPGGKAGRTSTNPLAFAIPLPDGKTFVLDMSTSAAAVGKIRLAWISGESCPPGLLQDGEGRPATDPAVMFAADPPGALLPMGGAQGYKGFGLSMMAECLAAGLAGGFMPPAPPDAPELNNVTVTAWDPSFFAGLTAMAEQAAAYLSFIRRTPPVDPAQPVQVAGDRSAATRAIREAQGIPLSAGTCRTLARSAEITGIPVPEECRPCLTDDA